MKSNSANNTPRTWNTSQAEGQRARPRSSLRERRKYVPGGPGGGGRFVQDGSTGTFGLGSPQSTRRMRRARARSPDEDENEDEDEYVPYSNGMSPTATFNRSRRQRPPLGPRQSSAAAAAAAMVQSDGYKPREERSWEEFHQDLDLDTELLILNAADVDGTSQGDVKNTPQPDSVPQSARTNDSHISDNPISSLGPGSPSISVAEDATGSSNVMGAASCSVNSPSITPLKRRPGRPPRRQDSTQNGFGSSPAPKLTPLPSHNPRERLNLPKPSYRKVETFAAFEQNKNVRINFVDRPMAHAGYQESDIFIRPEKTYIRAIEGSSDEDIEIAAARKADGACSSTAAPVGRVEYDMDEQDDKWLDAYNAIRSKNGHTAIKPAIFEITMTQIEKEWHALEKRIPKPNPKPPQTHRPRSSSAAAVNGEQAAPGEEQDTKCAVCDDGDCENTNAIVFCDGCDLAVHQECYGVPFIPEGQWLCRKCQLLGRGAASCIFCPNADGAFKQTNTLRWSHLLCAIWIPEVSLGNNTFMEPVMDVEKVPRQRWKLSCYICQQKMGACIQCGNKNCYAAFHVTCARRAKLFLKMKSTHGGPATLDASVLKAFCDKHVPSDWRTEHDVDKATNNAKEFYRNTMRGRRWTDSQQTALATANQAQQAIDASNEAFTDQSPNASNKRKRNQIPPNVWRLPSGAPIIPHTVLANIESFMSRYPIIKRKEFIAEACKYWTLKREARRGAALLKRLQLQMENFTTAEVTRRNFAGMGAAGRPRLLKRIEFSELLEQDLERVRGLCEQVKEREEEKLRDVYILKDILDTVYFPISRLLWPIFEKAQHLDSKLIFADGFSKIYVKLSERAYTSVSAFSADLSLVFSDTIGLSTSGNLTDVRQSIGGAPEVHSTLTTEQKEKKRHARYIVKAIHAGLEEAARKEAELSGRPYEKELKALDALLHGTFHADQDSSLVEVAEGIPEHARDKSLTNGINREYSEDLAHKIKASSEVSESNELATKAESLENTKKDTSSSVEVPDARERQSPADTPGDTVKSSEAVDLGAGSNLNDHSQTSQKNVLSGESLAANVDKMEFEQADAPAVTKLQHASTYTAQEPLTPPPSEKDLLAPFATGGIPWYFEPFDPVGTTIYDERWTGREVLRGMSEELSELDDDEVNGMMEEEKARKREEEKARKRERERERRRRMKDNRETLVNWQVLHLPVRETRAQKSRKLAAENS